MEEVEYGRWTPLAELQLDVPFVDIVLRIGGRLGLEVMSCGGLNGVVHRAYKCLQLLPMLTPAERLALERTPELTLVARPTQGQPPPPADDNTFVVAAIEHIDQSVKKLADAMAVGLLLRAQQNASENKLSRGRLTVAAPIRLANFNLTHSQSSLRGWKLMA